MMGLYWGFEKLLEDFVSRVSCLFRQEWRTVLISWFYLQGFKLAGAMEKLRGQAQEQIRKTQEQMRKQQELKKVSTQKPASKEA